MQKRPGLGFRGYWPSFPFNIGPKYEFVSSLVQNSPKQEPYSRSNTIFDARTILHGRTILHSRVVQNCPGLSFRL